MQHGRAAIFLDRDGTLIEDVGALTDPAHIQLFSDTVAALKKLQPHYLLFVVTNQSAATKTQATPEQLQTVNRSLHKQLEAEGITIQNWYTCPQNQDNSRACTQPQFALQAAKEYQLDLTRSFVIGDHPHDALMTNAQGVFGIYVLTGHGGRHLNDLPLEKPIFHRLSDAADWIIAHPEPQVGLDRQIEAGATAIRHGGVAAFPTETVYGLGADVFQPEAVKKIFQIKGRPHYNPLIAHIADPAQMNRLVPEIPELARKLTEAFWPGPLTIVLPKRSEVPDIVTGGHNTVAIRMPKHPIALELIRRCETALAAPSANAFTHTSPTTAQHVIEQLGNKCDVVIDGGACRVGVESTVITLAGPEPTVLRPGGVTVEEIERVIGPVQVASGTTEKDTESPGMMAQHYAPATTLHAFDTIPTDYENAPDIGVILFKNTGRTFQGPVEILSSQGDTKEAAANFYAAIRRLDELGLREIVAEYAPGHGLGIAINNRLSKAAKGRIK